MPRHVPALKRHPRISIGGLEPPQPRNRTSRPPSPPPTNNPHGGHTSVAAVTTSHYDICMRAATVAATVRRLDETET